MTIDLAEVERLIPENARVIIKNGTTFDRTGQFAHPQGKNVGRVDATAGGGRHAARD